MLAALALSSCATRPLPPPPPREPPPRVLATTVDRISLRASAYVELHLWLAGLARTGASSPDPDIDAAAHAYASALANDDRDEMLSRTTQALLPCASDRCARRALAEAPFATAYEDVLPSFIARHWGRRAAVAQVATMASRAVMGPELDAVVSRLTVDLALDWPADPTPVAVVGTAPPIGRAALVPVALAARGPCFVARAKERARMRNARVSECVLVQALMPVATRSRLFDAIARELPEREAERAWALVVVHAVAATLTAWAPEHVSPMRKSALAVERAVLTWLADHWRERARGEDIDVFAKRYAESFSRLAEPR